MQEPGQANSVRDACGKMSRGPLIPCRGHYCPLVVARIPRGPLRYGAQLMQLISSERLFDRTASELEKDYLAGRLTYQQFEQAMRELCKEFEDETE
jgi:hypothetical protein